MRILMNGNKPKHGRSLHHFSIKKRQLKKELSKDWDFQNSVENSWLTSDCKRQIKNFCRQKYGIKFRSCKKALAYDARQNPDQTAF